MSRDVTDKEQTVYLAEAPGLITNPESGEMGYQIPGLRWLQAPSK